ncbi:hypothetical protein Tco_0454606 [Tanacetum coccineum]
MCGDDDGGIGLRWLVVVVAWSNSRGAVVVMMMMEVVTPSDGAWMKYMSEGVTLLSISSTKHKERPLRVGDEWCEGEWAADEKVRVDGGCGVMGLPMGTAGDLESSGGDERGAWRRVPRLLGGIG